MTDDPARGLPDDQRVQTLNDICARRANAEKMASSVAERAAAECRAFTADERRRWDDLNNWIDHLDREYEACARPPGPGAVLDAQRERILSAFSVPMIDVTPIESATPVFIPAVPGLWAAPSSVTSVPSDAYRGGRVRREPERVTAASTPMIPAGSVVTCADCHSDFIAAETVPESRSQACEYCTELRGLLAQQPQRQPVGVRPKPAWSVPRILLVVRVVLAVVLAVDVALWIWARASL